MRCRNCNVDMDIARVYDEGGNGDIAWNLWVCDRCGVVCRENVWAHSGQVWVYPNGRVTSFTETEQGSGEDE